MVVVGLRQQWIGIASIVVVEGVEVEAPQIVVVVQEGFLAGPNIEVWFAVFLIGICITVCEIFSS